MAIFDESIKAKFGKGVAEIADHYMDFVRHNVPYGVACVFACSEDGHHIAVVVGGHDPDSVVYDLMITKMAQHIGNRRNEESAQEVVDAGHRETDEEKVDSNPSKCWPFPTGAKN